MNLLLSQVDRITAFQKALREEFETSWSPQAGLIVAGAFVTIVLLVWYLSRREARTSQATPRGDPDKLFRDLTQKLPLATSQRQWLVTMVQELKLPQPSVILFSRNLLEQSYAQWVSRRAAAPGEAGEPSDRHLFAQVRAALFPQGPEPDSPA